MSLQYIRNHYQVPARRGAKVQHNGRKGIVTSARGPHVRVLMQGERKPRIYHPTDLEWL